MPTNTKPLSPEKTYPIERKALLERASAGDSSALPAVHSADKRLDRAQTRYLGAIKALATVQKLLKPMPSAFDLLRRPVAEAPDSLAARAKAAPVPACG